MRAGCVIPSVQLGVAGARAVTSVYRVRTTCWVVGVSSHVIALLVIMTTEVRNARLVTPSAKTPALARSAVGC